MRTGVHKLALAGLAALGVGFVLEVLASFSFSVVCNCPAMRAGDDVSVMCPCIAEPRLAAAVLSAAGFSAIIAGAVLLAIGLKKRKKNPS